MKAFCVNCGRDEKTIISKEKRVFKVRNVEVEVIVTVLKCQKCGEEIYDYKTEKANDLLINDAYKEKVGLLTSSEIKQIRKKMGLNQESMSSLLSLGKKTITRYENGSIQDRTQDNLIRQIRPFNSFLYPQIKEYMDKSPVISYKNYMEHAERKSDKKISFLIQALPV